jgi:guanylate kinase
MPTKGLKKFLTSQTKEELIKHIQELDKKYKSVQEYHQLYLNNDVETVVAKYKKQIKNEFYPSRGLPKMCLTIARKAITKSKKLGIPSDLNH